MMEERRHLLDDELIDAYIDAPLAPLARMSADRGPHAGHLRTCPQCAGRFEALESALGSVEAYLAAEADAVMTPERVARQREQVLRRLEHEERAARLLHFPAATPMRSMPPAHRVTRRWVAAAAAAGLVIGLAAGRLADFRPGDATFMTRFRPAAPAVQTRLPASEPTLRTALAVAPNEDLFLLELDAALAGPAVAELQAIDALTPRIVEVGAIGAR